MVQLSLEHSSIRLVLSCLNDQCVAILRRIDNLRKMKGSIDDRLYDSINIRYQEELQLVQHTIMVTEGQF